MAFLSWVLCAKHVAKTLISVCPYPERPYTPVHLTCCTRDLTAFLVPPVFVDAPYVLTPVDMAFLNTLSNSSSLEDLGAPEAAAEQDPALAPRGWWKAQADRDQTAGLEESLAVLRDVLAKDHYDVRLSHALLVRTDS